MAAAGEKKKAILFIDDEQKLLEGIKRNLRSQSDEWQLHFARDGAEALKIVEQTSLHVVVADLRMPGLIGTEVLDEVRKKQPAALRMLLSGESEDRIGPEAYRLAHRVFAKPCARNRLKETLESLIRLQDEFGSGIIAQKISKIDRLPSIPESYWRLRELIDSHVASIDEIVAAVSLDMSMVTKLLQTVNSIFGERSSAPITDIKRAVSLLGVNLICNLMLAGCFVEEFKPDSCPQFDATELWRRSLLVSKLAHRIASQEGLNKDGVEYSAVGGLLHGVGRLVLATCAPEEYGHCLALQRESGRSLGILEKEVLGTTSSAVGGYLTGIWGLAEPLVECIRFHSCPARAPTHNQFSALTAVHVAAAIAGADVTLDVQYLKRINCQDAIDSWRKLAI